MMNRQTLCMGCMKDKGDAVVCPFCGWSNDRREQPPFLNTGLTMLNRYVIGKKLRSNGESVVYMGFDIQQKCAVEIREFFPLTLCKRNPQSGEILINPGKESVYREYLKSFLEISRSAARLGDLNNIVKTYDIFEFNHSAYVISEHTSGIPLRSYIEKKGCLPYNIASKVFIPLVSSMISAHSIGLYHFGISPDSLILTPDGKLKLPDFGLPEAHLAETELTPQLYEGYSAIEQYYVDGKKGSWTDVYSLSAVFFYMLTGKNPPPATARKNNPSLTIPKELVQSIPVYAVSAIAGGLQVVPDQRIETVERLKSSLTVKSQNVPANEPTIKKASGFSGRGGEFVPAGQETSGSAVGEKMGGFWDKITDRFNLSENRRTNLKYGLISCLVSFVILSLVAYAVFTMFFKDMVKPGTKPVDSGTVSDNTSQETESLPENDSVMFDVPNLSGKAYDSAVSDYSMFDIIVTGHDFSDSIAEGRIISQNVEAGSQCASGSPIGVVVSKGPSQVKIPKIIGKTVSEADEILIAAGLNLGLQTEEFSDTVEMGKIIGISGGFKEGSKVDSGSYINIVVSKGPEPVN